MTEFDFIVAGSGATGAMAAQTLAQRGASVLILDGGRRDTRYAGLIPPKAFVDIRREEEEQHRYFLGDRFESAAYREIAPGAQFTPPREFIVDGVDELLKVRSDSFAPVESLARGGLASGWGLHCGVYSDAELERASLPAADMHDAYQTVADRIGISGAAGDDARPYTYGDLQRIQPPLPLDPTAEHVAARYARNRALMNARGYHLGRPTLALLSQPKDGRNASALRDMDFYDDAERAAWRPAVTLGELAALPNVAYAGNVLMTRFEERDGWVDAVVRDIDGGEERRYGARRLVLACGALGTARVVLRSLPSDGVRLPLLCNAYTYMPCVVPHRVGRAMPERNNSLVQLALFHDADGTQRDIAVGTIFTYRSLMLFRLLRETPLNVRDARIFMQYLLSGLLIAGIDHPQAPSDGKRLWLEPDPASPTGDALAIAFELSAGERIAYDARERGFARTLRSLGAWPVKRIRPPLGSSIHYAGTLPFAANERDFTLGSNGRLRGTSNVFVADGSGFTFLPAKGLTLSLMANAHRIATGLAQ